MRPWYKNLDLPVLGAWMALVAVGLTAIYSVTHGPASEFLLLTVQKNFERQAMWFGISAFAMLVILLLPARWLFRLAVPAYIVGVGLLASAILFGHEVNGAKAWLYIGPIGLQPGELAKVGTIMLASRLLALNPAREGKWSFLLMVGGVVLLPAALLLLANDTGTALVFMSLVPVLLFWSGAVSLPIMSLMAAPIVAGYFSIVSLPIALLVGIAFPIAMYVFTRSSWLTVFAVGASLGVAIAAYVGLNKVLQPYQVERVIAFANPERPEFRQTVGFHVIQSKAAIGSGGFFGKGFTNGTQTQMAFIPEQSTDFVFTVIGEEFGFVGGMVVLGLFAFLLVRLAGLGTQAGFAFPRLFCAGVTGIFLVHILINIGMTVGLMPVIGIPLPLVSYGGTALLANTTMIAIALNLHARRDEFAVYTA
ncbi:MAG TPA: FtsW/RodA/SpoVE family cell cycle protein [Rhodothermales bacterium]|nr:FtsW/RodA/SpoVE family cell cycle protein [Rhodothermales bacterium]